MLVKKIYSVLFVLFLLLPVAANAQEDSITEEEAMDLAPQVEYYRATVKEVKTEGEEKIDSISAPQLPPCLIAISNFYFCYNLRKN